jgi:hypothetical protein
MPTLSRTLLFTLVPILSFSTPSLGQPDFETRCDSLEPWTLIDLDEGGKASVEEDPSAPAGYGPKVLKLRGDETLLISEAGKFRTGTLLALWKDEEPTERDCDGVILFQADYPEDLTVATNTNDRRPHSWIEQDDDTGFQIKRQPAEGKDTPLIVQAGVGKTQDEWNQTGWMWQKLRVEEGRIRAKFWSTAVPEPEKWQIDRQGWQPVEGRVGLKVWSGNGSIAYFAVSREEDLRPPIAPLEISSPRHLWFLDERPQVFLYLNLAEGFPIGTLRLSGAQEGSEAEISEIEVPLPAGHTAIAFGAGAQSESFPLPTRLREGTAVLSAQLLDMEGKEIASATRTLELRSTDFYQRRFEQFAQRIQEALEEEPEDASRAALEALSARALLNRATEAFAEGAISQVDRALNHVEAALSTDTQVVTMTAKPVRLPARSWSMGQTYRFPITFRSLTERPEKDLIARIELTDELISETPAAQEVTLPASAWKEGEQTVEVTLPIPKEYPRTSDQPLELPVIREGRHLLWVSVREKDSGQTLWMDLPRARPGDFSRHHRIAEVFITPHPVEISRFDPAFEQPGGGLSSVALAVRNLAATETLRADLSLRVLSESGTLLETRVHPIELKGGEEISLQDSFPDFNWFGPLDLDVELLSQGPVLGRVSERIEIPTPEGWRVEVVKKGEIWRTQGKLYTTLLFTAAPPPGWKSSVDIPISIRHKGLDWGAFERRLTPDTEKTFELGVTPGIGTYQVTVSIPTQKGPVWRREFRLIAPVFETYEGNLHLNGEPFVVKGVNVHGIIGQSPRRTRMLLALLKDIGFNMVRGDYPPTWEVEMAAEEGIGWLVLAPFSVTNTDALEERYGENPYLKMREATRRFIDTYRDLEAAWFWNSCNEVTGEIDDFLTMLYPLYKALDPASRPVVYANLTGQDRTLGQDLMGINYYYDHRGRVEDRQPLVADGIRKAREAGIPVIYNEFNTWHGPVYTQGAAALRGFFEWGIEEGMAGGFYYQLRDDHGRHPGVISDDNRVWTSPTLLSAFRKAFQDAEVGVKSRTSGQVVLEIRNRREFTLRDVSYRIEESGRTVGEGKLNDIPPASSTTLTLGMSDAEEAHVLEALFDFNTHFGIAEKVEARLMIPPR